MKTVRQQQDERRQAKLEQIRRQVAEGSLVIRRMSSEERAQNPPVPPKQKRS